MKLINNYEQMIKQLNKIISSYKFGFERPFLIDNCGKSFKFNYS